MRTAQHFAESGRSIEVLTSYTWIEAHLLLGDPDHPLVYKGRLPNRTWIETVTSSPALLLLAIGGGFLRRVS